MQSTGLTAQSRTLEQIETEIKAHSQYMTESIIAIGKALTEAKAQLQHGEWKEWLTDRVNFSQRTANNFMLIAREIDAASTLAALPYTKVLALLDVPPDQREQVAVDMEADTRSAAALRKAIADRKKAEQAKAEAEQKAEAERKSAERANDLYEQLSEKFAGVQSQLEAERGRTPDIVTETVPPDDYEELQRKAAEAEALKKRAETAEKYALAQEQAAKDAQAQARKLSAQQIERGVELENEPYSPQRMGEAVRAFMGAMGAIPNMAAYFAAMPYDRLQQYRPWIETIGAWAIGAKTAIDGGGHVVDADAVIS